MHTGYVLFQNDTVQGLLARVLGIIGPFPEWMMKEGRLVKNFFTKDEKLLYQDVVEDQDKSQHLNDTSNVGPAKKKGSKTQILVPKQSSLRHRLGTDDMMYIDFVRWCLEIDPNRRPSAKEALNHPWFTEAKYKDGLVNGE